MLALVLLIEGISGHVAAYLSLSLIAYVVWCDVIPQVLCMCFDFSGIVSMPQQGFEFTASLHQSDCHESALLQFALSTSSNSNELTMKRMACTDRVMNGHFHEHATVQT